MSAGRLIARNMLDCASVVLLAACGQSADNMANTARYSSICKM